MRTISLESEKLDNIKSLLVKNIMQKIIAVEKVIMLFIAKVLLTPSLCLLPLYWDISDPEAEHIAIMDILTITINLLEDPRAAMNSSPK